MGWLNDDEDAVVVAVAEPVEWHDVTWGRSALMKYIIAVAIAFCVAIVSATGQQVDADTSANAAFLGCKAFAEGRITNATLANQAGFCAGVVHGLSSVAEYLTPPEWQSCAPPTSDARQLARVVISYIEARPQRMHEDFRRLTLEAFHNAWPCKTAR